MIITKHYNRIEIIFVDKNQCNICKQEKKCLHVDTSQHLYEELRICQTCIEKLFIQKITIK